jgi:hypothetical protein
MQLYDKIKENIVLKPSLSSLEAYYMGKRELAILYKQYMEIISGFPPINSIISSIQRFKHLIYPVGLLNQSDLYSERFKLLNGLNILLHSNIRTENEKLMISGKVNI